MKTGLTVEELEKIKPPYLIKSYTPRAPSRVFLNNSEIGIDENGALYVKPELEASGLVTRSGEYNKEAAENNPLFYYTRPRKPWPESQEWHKVADAKHIEEVKVFNEPKHFQQFVMRIFGDK